MSKTLEIEQKGVKLVDASAMAVRVRPQKAVSREEEQEWQVLMESVGRNSDRLERTSAWNGQESLEKTWKNAASQGRERAIKRGEKVEKGRITEASRRNEREDGHERMKEEEGREQKRKEEKKKKLKEKEKEKEKKKKKKMLMLMLMPMMLMPMMMRLMMLMPMMMRLMMRPLMIRPMMMMMTMTTMTMTIMMTMTMTTETTMPEKETRLD